MTFGIQQHLRITICKDADEAIAKGFNYGSDYRPIEIDQAVVVRNGTVEGNSTVDLVMRDEQGQKYVVMLTGNLLRSIPLGGAA